MATAQYPTAIPDNITGSGNSELTTISHTDGLHDKDRKEIVAIATKLGTWATTPLANRVLCATGSERSEWLTVGADYFTAGTTVIRKIAELSGTGASGVFVFQSIPATYRSLLIILAGRTDAAVTSTNVTLTFENPPTAAAYNHQFVYGNNTTVAASESIDASGIIVTSATGANVTAGTCSSAVIWIPEYASASLYKSVMSRSLVANGLASGNFYGDQLFGLWESTAAIDLIRLTLAAGNWTTASRATLYGVPG